MLIFVKIINVHIIMRMCSAPSQSHLYQFVALEISEFLNTQGNLCISILKNLN